MDHPLPPSHFRTAAALLDRLDRHLAVVVVVAAVRGGDEVVHDDHDAALDRTGIQPSLEPTGWDVQCSRSQYQRGCQRKDAKSLDLLGWRRNPRREPSGCSSVRKAW